MNNADLVQLRSIQSDITYFKEDILKSIKVIENKLTQKITLQTTNMNDTLTSYNKNFEHVYQKIKDLAELITTDNTALDKIATLLTFKASTIENLTAFDVKQNRIDIDLQNAIFKYDKIILEHILYPSIIGNNCKFRTMHDFVDYCLNQISHFNSFKDKQILDLKSYKTKLETVIKSFQTQIESITKTYSQLTDKKVNESELKMKSRLKVYDDRLEDIRIENGTYAVQLKNLCESLSKEWQGVLSIKNDIETTIQTQVDVIKEDNAKVVMCFENYQNEFKGIKSKFNVLSDAIKDIRKQLGALGRKSVVCKEHNECECGRRGSLREMVMNGFSGKDAESFLKKYIKGEVDLNMMMMNQERRRSNKQRRESKGSCGSFGNDGKGGNSRRISIVKGKYSGKGVCDGNNNNNRTMEDEERDYEEDKGSYEEKKKKGKDGNYKRKYSNVERKNKSGSRKRECDNESSLSESCEDINNNKEWNRKGIREKEHKKYKNEIINETDDYSENVNSHNSNINENNVNIKHHRERKYFNNNNNNKNNKVHNKEPPKSEVRKLKNISIKPFFINVNFDKNNKHLNTDNNPAGHKCNTNLQSDSESENDKEHKHNHNHIRSTTSNNSINNSTNNINQLQHQPNLSYDNINISNNKQPQMPIGSVRNNQIETFSKTTTNLTKNNPLNLKSYSSSSNHKLTNIQKQSVNPNNANHANNTNQQKSRNYNSQSPHPQTKQQQRHYPNIILSDTETQQDKIHLHKLKLKQLELNLNPLNSVALFNNTNVRSSNNNINNKNIQNNQNRTHTKQFYNANNNNNVNARSLSRNKTRNEELKQSNSYSVFPFLNANPSSTFKGHKRNYTSSNIITNSNKAYDPSVSSIECIRGIKLENKNKLKEVNYFRTFFAENNNNNNGNSTVYNSLNNIGRNGNKNAKKIPMQLKEDNTDSNNSTINGVHYMPINKILTNIPKNIPEGKNVLLTNPERYYIKEVEFEKQCK